MNHTKIEWVKNPDGTRGYTWNPITGCLNHDDKGRCLGGGFPCYAYQLAHGRLMARYLHGRGRDWKVALDANDRQYHQACLDPFYPRFWEDRLHDFGSPNAYGYQRIRKPKGIFVCDMGELFGDCIPDNWQEAIFDCIGAYPEHRFYLLTKQPQNLIKRSPFPENCYVGVTITHREAAHTTNFYLPEIKAKIKFISLEPLLDDVMQYLYMRNLIKACNWVIIGAQTKPYKPPEKMWVDKITEACKKAGIPYFLKDNLQPLLGDNLIQDMPSGLH